MADKDSANAFHRIFQVVVLDVTNVTFRRLVSPPVGAVTHHMYWKTTNAKVPLLYLHLYSDHDVYIYVIIDKTTGKPVGSVFNTAVQSDVK